MARILPELTAEQLAAISSGAEATFYRACRKQLDENSTVLYSISWIMRHHGIHASDGEADFLIIMPSIGLLVVEVKGGGISFNAQTAAWTSIDRNGFQHPIKNPFFQARDACYSILSKLREHPKWNSVSPFRSIVGYGVAFPDLFNKAGLVGPDRPSQIIATADDLENLGEWFVTAIEWWKNEDRRAVALDNRAVPIIEQMFAKSFKVRPLTVQRINEEEKQRITLTMQQARILRTLGCRRRVAIRGGAGTGKTVIAMEKVRQLAKEEYHTLFLCYNRPLGEYLKSVFKNFKLVEASSFHEFCGHHLSLASREYGRNFLQEAEQQYPGADKYQILLPFALALALEISKEMFDAVVIDEAQDFFSEFWLPVEMLLADSVNSPLYVFYDNNQALYQRPREMPVDPNEVFELTINCRNTKVIHQLAYRYYQGSPTDPPTIVGVPVRLHQYNGVTQQARVIVRKTIELIHNDRVAPEDIAVLSADPLVKASFQQIIRNHPLPNGIKWIFDSIPRAKGVRYDSVHRFKGMEAPIVFLWGIDTLAVPEAREVLYVGLSRPLSELHVVGRSDSCQSILKGGC